MQRMLRTAVGLRAHACSCVQRPAYTQLTLNVPPLELFFISLAALVLATQHANHDLPIANCPAHLLNHVHEGVACLASTPVHLEPSGPDSWSTRVASFCSSAYARVSSHDSACVLALVRVCSASRWVTCGAVRLGDTAIAAASHTLVVRLRLGSRLFGHEQRGHLRPHDCRIVRLSRVEFAHDRRTS